MYVTGNPSSSNNSSSGGSSGPGQQQQTQQTSQSGSAQNGGQADFSAQWAEYYRSIGKIKEAEAIEAQMKVGKVSYEQLKISHIARIGYNFCHQRLNNYLISLKLIRQLNKSRKVSRY